MLIIRNLTLISVQSWTYLLITIEDVSHQITYRSHLLEYTRDSHFLLEVIYYKWL